LYITPLDVVRLERWSKAMIDTQRSPTVRRRRLAAELRRLREASGKTHEEVAAALDWHRSKVGRIEGAQFVRLSLTDLRALLELYGATDKDQRESLITLAKESRERGWWHSYADVLPNPHSVLIGLEAETVSIRAYQAQLVPGLLQTEDYTRAILKATRMTSHEADEVERFVEVRRARQALLNQEPPVTLWVVIDEGVLRRRVGGTSVMGAQIERLIEVSELPHVTLQVLPDAAGEHAGLEGSFMILGFSEGDRDAVYLDAATGGLYMEKPDDIRRYAWVFDHVRAAALSPRDTVRFLQNAVADLRQRGGQE
jgi:transcriptional regulator with XRE-family HTH domain